MHNVFLVHFYNLYMFRAYLGPSSGGTTVCIQQLVLIILFRCLSVVLVGLAVPIQPEQQSWDCCEINPRGRFPHKYIWHAVITKVCLNKPYPMTISTTIFVLSCLWHQNPRYVLSSFGFYDSNHVNLGNSAIWKNTILIGFI
jgi:hypothetical protein